ncbi:MAG: 4Fe-4S binding protein, partial [Clostridia bacterium]|nr:4Fe-4S binding protein [Clostridia bacterium]
ERHLLMPYNIMFRYPDALARQMYTHTRGMAELIAEKAVQNAWERLAYNPLTVLWMWLLRLQWLGARINGPLIHARRDLCVGCGLCAENCPARNITMRDGLPHFSGRCTMCMSCAFRCPQDAVRPGVLNPWRVNGPYPFEKLAADESLPDSYVNEHTKGYFRLFRAYYRRSGEELAALKKKEE